MSTAMSLMWDSGISSIRSFPASTRRRDVSVEPPSLERFGHPAYPEADDQARSDESPSGQ